LKNRFCSGFEVEVHKKIDNFDKEIAEKVEANYLKGNNILTLELDT